ncbi:MAG: hypothetical protein WAW17_02880 [Rhodococcus sp. (in: high G+C Gram-positive bacteria)]|uniref:Acg family FMN-binding oxidoreductase n=1 Tax=Rhodococcus sp. TaxID=1831 RepID=UPI003BAFAC33
MDAGPDRRTIEAAVALACRAPSLHNTQPWRWVVGPSHLQLYSDPERLLPATDASGRQMVLSCGAALDHLRVAFASTAWQPIVHRLPNPLDHQLLSSIEFIRGPAPTIHETAMFTAIGRRRTERLPLAPPPDWARTLDELTALADEFGVHISNPPQQGGRALADASHRVNSLRSQDPSYQAELAWWSDHAQFPEGVPEAVLPSGAQRPSVSLAREFPEGSSSAPGSAAQDRAEILVLTTSTDSRFDWLRCGEALSSLLLACTIRDLATCPVTHLTELPESRAVVRELCDDDRLPQVLIRVGVAPGPGTAPATPRRPLSEVLFHERF